MKLWGADQLTKQNTRREKDLQKTAVLWKPEQEEFQEVCPVTERSEKIKKEGKYMAITESLRTLLKAVSSEK